MRPSGIHRLCSDRIFRRPAASRSGTGCWFDLINFRAERLFRQYIYRGSPAHRQFRGSSPQMHPLQSRRNFSFTIRSSSEWNDIAMISPPGARSSYASARLSLDRRQLVVHRDPQRLEDPGRRMDVPHVKLPRDRPEHDVRELARSFRPALLLRALTMADAILRAHRSSPSRKMIRPASFRRPCSRDRTRPHPRRPAACRASRPWRS